MSTAALTPRADERWLAGASPVERLSATMALLVLGSVALHVAMMAAALVGTRAAAPAQQEIAVEIVREEPKQTPAPEPPVTKAEQAKAEVPKSERAKEIAKPQPAKAAPAAKTEPAKIAPAKIEAAKTEPAKIAPAKIEPAKTERAVEPAKPPVVPPAPPIDPAADARKAATIKAMERELEHLKAEHAALQAENAAAERTAAAAESGAARPVALRDTGLGPLPDSFQAVALPATADGAGEAAGYRDIVFSALAKAKEIGGHMGFPGTAGVHFEIGAEGRLLSVELVHPSGDAALDAQALTIVRKAAPFPPPPQGAQRSFDAEMTFAVARGR